MADRDHQAALTRRRSTLQQLWALEDQVVLIGAGDPIAVPGRGDLTYPFG